MTSRTGSARRILKKSVSWVLLRKKTVDFRLLAEARPVALWRVPYVLWGGGRWKSQNRKNVYLSPYVDEPLNWKFRTWTKKSSFSCFGIPMFYVYMLWTFYVRFAYPYHGYGTQQLYGYLTLISKNIQLRRTRHAGHCWRSKEELISDLLQWTTTHGCVGVGWPARTYLHQLCEDTWICLIGTDREKESGKSVLSARFDDDDEDDDILAYILLRTSF